MSTQFKLKDDWKPVGSSKMWKSITDWMNAIAKQLNRAEVVSGGTARPTDLGFRIEVDGVAAYPFQLTHSSSAIRVRVGSRTRRGTTVTLVPDTDKEYKSITELTPSAAFGSATYVVYAKLVSATADPAITPSSLTVHAATSMPADTDNIYLQLGTATAVSGAITGVEQTRTGGNKDDDQRIPDANGLADDGTDYRYYSLEKSPRAGIHNGTDQIYDWDAPTQESLDTADLFMFQDVSDNNKHLRYVTIDDLGGYISDNFDPDGGGGGAIGDWLNDNNYIIHTNLDFTDTGDLWAAKGVGKSGYNTDHDDSYWRTFADGSFIDTKTFKTSGLLEITNTTAASESGGAIYAPNGGIAGGEGCHFLKGSADQAGFFERSVTEYVAIAQAGTMMYIDDGSNILNLCNGVEAILASGDVKIDGTTGDYYHNGSQGWSGTFQVTQSGVTKDVTVSGGIITDVS